MIRLSDLIAAEERRQQPLPALVFSHSPHPVRVRFLVRENVLVADAQRRADAARGRRPRHDAQGLALSRSAGVPAVVADAIRRAEAAARR